MEEMGSESTGASIVGMEDVRVPGNYLAMLKARALSNDAHVRPQPWAA